MKSGFILYLVAYLEGVQPEVVAVARNEGPAHAVSLRRGGHKNELSILYLVFEFFLDGSNL